MRGFRLIAGLAALGVSFAALRAERSVETSFEAATTSDVALWQAGAVAKFDRRAAEYTLGLASTLNEIDYRPVPFDFQGYRRNFHRTNLAAQGAVRLQTGRAWTLLGGAGVYSGFTNYRSIWLDEYYRQQYAGLTFLSGYRPAHPRGFNLSAGARWEYLPATGFLQANLSWLQDQVAPGYEIDFDGLHRGQDSLSTAALEVTLENVVTPRLRSLVTLRAVRTTDRQVRVGAELAAHYALGDRWTLRASFGGAHENPTFIARFADLALERELRPHWFLAVTGRVYRDTGEIENALLFTSAAPPLSSRQFGVSLRGEYDRVSWRLSFSPLIARSAPTNPNTDFFQYLYRDRDWTLIRAAVSFAL